ncbi:vacuolar transporter [bacterium (Candidatus Blackallbacteria) CG17_big_fil_post_rev_8_21_14_2_50_48_46]|uniref:Vacuolar transporter n=1 Tax=bacterium (Candidatus Blackallbacteria) CG17_big_fil_post_rev_8_21_14_2_50_48_46 TaxID=2014261 RepID=A0A2M7G8S9_9BACT|nr:MAG: vacuolar transporter [bacterium (Candidatus Blackallbacteria) CG18_big_fil_WC_8_21_14_2_50_49_26]PIW18503.1 MAG: vacuolar transporter [bacterium (Candidatus Blackallbacteria) CG17_big_fil_post_rev_8_21_14_2_50_48_46]PIW46512.1 MAG: vacuolar transporter [bacterium (Candidatus Blackallbacteria) CG13_big_fil_rev_8_21_14_2_50_49_14]
MIRRFNRFELKYLITSAQAERLKQALIGHVEADSFSGSRGYPVLSLYYDSPNHDFFWDKIEGLKFRRKLRIRAYPQADQSGVTQAMVEIKQRINKTVQKRRLKLPLEKAYELCSGKLEGVELDPLDAAVVSEVKYLVNAKNLRPSCLISYHRQAYQGNQWNSGLRITFDTELKTSVRDLKLDSSAQNSYFIPPDWCILEIKVDERVPDWLASLLSSQELELRRISKYCAGLAHAHQIQIQNQELSPFQAQDFPEPLPVFKILTPRSAPL